MQTNEVRMLADHMGHDLNIHANHYALQSSVVERAKVARILLAVEAGNLHKLNAPAQLESVPDPEVQGNRFNINELIYIHQWLLVLR